VRSLRPDEVGPAAYIFSGAAAAFEGKTVAMTEAWRQYRKRKAWAEVDTRSDCPGQSTGFFYPEDWHGRDCTMRQRSSDANTIQQ
jgi:hypothetical protein